MEGGEHETKKLLFDSIHCRSQSLIFSWRTSQVRELDYILATSINKMPSFHMHD